jgi:CubicO group peptidase (beta-lactamase class C family)
MFGSTGEYGSAMMPDRLERLHDPDDIVNIRDNNHIARYDSVSLDSFIQAYMETAHIPGLATWCFKNGQVIWQQCYGYANLEDSIEVADTTLFTLFSISKTITGTAIMQLWERGLFGLDDDINDYLPFSVRCPAYPDSAITFRMLMTHTSSIHDYDPIISPLWVAWGDSPIPLGTFLQEYLVPGGSYYSTANYNGSVPGTQYEYSNVGIGLLGYLVEAIEDSFPIHCQDSIFNPLSMYETSWFLANLDTNNLARAYHWTGSIYNHHPWWGGPFYPSFQLRSSVAELAQYLTAIVQYGAVGTVRILDSTTVELILSHQFEVGGDWWIGLIWHHVGWMFAGRWVWFHNGAGDGGDTFMAFCPDENSAVISLTNCDNYACSWTIAEALLDYAQQYAIEEHVSSKPLILTLRVNPNPFKHSTNIRFMIQDSGYKIQNKTLRIYDATGRLVKSFNHESCIMDHVSTISWDGTDQANRQLPSGVYFVKIKAGDYSATEKLLLIK